jgi:hypothetical protein
MHQYLAFSESSSARALDFTLTAAPEPEKISRKDAKNTQQNVTECLIFALWRLCVRPAFFPIPHHFRRSKSTQFQT